MLLLIAQYKTSKERNMDRILLSGDHAQHNIWEVVDYKATTVDGFIKEMLEARTNACGEVFVERIRSKGHSFSSIYTYNTMQAGPVPNPTDRYYDLFANKRVRYVKAFGTYNRLDYIIGI